ncbi:MAG TPA: GAF domain-containing protein [Flavisolibacter sp.]|nr:GAF domain-containing protein [Flavisolibacter sp.]
MDQKLNLDSDFCGKVPLHQTNLVQPHGVLLIVDRASQRIIQASENAAQIFGADIREIVSRPLNQFIGDEQVARLAGRFKDRTDGKLPFIFSLPSGKYLASVQPHPQHFAIEMEKEGRPEEDEESFVSIYEDLKYAMNAVEAASDTAGTGYAAIRELKRISGFDKIMIYRFDEEWNGDVIAEVKEEGMDSYLGLKFPASDVPRQARELYKRTAYRLIPNINYDPVRLYPVINPMTNAFTDLSDSNLRSVAAVHIEYLRNMQVMASMSTRILVDGQLWGLIACHHRTPKYLSFEMCVVFELLSNVISAKISLVQQREVFEFKTGRQAMYSRIIDDVYREDNLTTGIYKNSREMMEMLNADGLAIVLNKHTESFGIVPSDSEIQDLILWLQSIRISKLYHQPSLASVFEPAEKYVETASGLLVLPVHPDQGAFILAFRQEAVRKVNWGGNPGEAVRFESDGVNYHPRNSFKLWQQTVKQTSVPWRKEELEMAEQFRNFAVEFTLNKIYSSF